MKLPNIAQNRKWCGVKNFRDNRRGSAIPSAELSGFGLRHSCRSREYSPSGGNPAQPAGGRLFNYFSK
jgi:hypothetical protein